MTGDFPPRRAGGGIYLTEGGAETEVMYLHGRNLPEFSMYPLMDDPEALEAIRDMYRRYMQAAADHGAGIVMAAFDYRASPDWARKIGYSLDELASFIRRNFEFLSDIREAYRSSVPDTYIVAAIGPRGDAYGTGGTISAEEAEEYHSFQIEHSKAAGADMVTPMTFNNVPEAIGAVRAAGRAGIPIGLSLTLTTESRLRSGPTLADAISEIDEETGGTAAWFGTNCSHPLEFEPALADPGPWADRLRYIRPNASPMDKIALCKLGHLEDGDPVELGQQMADVHRRFPKADILGGCCGTDARHLGEIAKAAA